MRLPLQTLSPFRGAVLPDRVLDEPGKSLRKRWIELSGIDVLGNDLNDIRAAAESVASQPVLVLRLEPLQDPGPVQKVMNQRVDGDHAAADLGPEDHLFGSAEQKAGQGHGEDLGRNGTCRWPITQHCMRESLLN
jgi:hypothetical protein